MLSCCCQLGDQIVKTRTITGLLSTLMMCGAAHAEDTYIACEITSTYDFSTDKTSPTSGSDSFVRHTEPNGSNTWTLPFACDPDTIISHERATEYFFACDKDMGNG